MKRPYIRCLPLILFLFFFTTNVSAQPTFVYTNNNTIPANSVTAILVGPTGTLSNIGTFASGGIGSVAGFFAANHAKTCMVGNRLYIANDGSNDVTGFDINPTTGALTVVPGSPFTTGASAGMVGISLDCTPNGRFLTVANGVSNNITVFGIASNGALSPVPGSPFAAGGTPTDVKVSPNGKFLSAALVFSNTVAMFSIGSNGTLTPVPDSPFSSSLSLGGAGVDINCESSFLYLSHPYVPGTIVSVFSIASDGKLTLVQTSDNPGIGTNCNNVLLSPDDKFLFVANNYSDTVTVFDVASNGTLSLVPGSPFGRTGGQPGGMVTNPAGTFLFTANFTDSNISSFSIGNDGSLTIVGTLPTGQPRFSGLRSLAVFPSKACVIPKTFDICLQDESNGSLLQINYTTGEYQFTNCSGVTITGTGTLTKKGSLITLQHNAIDRRVLARIDGSSNRATASIQLLSQAGVFTITDKDTANNACFCR